jgi:hypothetical protein
LCCVCVGSAMQTQVDDFTCRTSFRSVGICHELNFYVSVLLFYAEEMELQWHNLTYVAQKH